MPARSIRVLHIEDDPAQRRVIAHHLSGMERFAFSIVCCDSEEAAVQTFQEQNIELVILDYLLSQGNGASCLRRLRDLDSIVPIIAISGAATPEITEQLLQLGADDFIDKHSLDSQILIRSVREALTRADGFRLRASACTDTPFSASPSLEHLCIRAIEQLGAEYLCLMSEFEEILRRSNVSMSQVVRLFESTCRSIEAKQPELEPFALNLVRPIMLETLFRLFGDIPCPSTTTEHSVNGNGNGTH